jgi:cytochrome c553
MTQVEPSPKLRTHIEKWLVPAILAAILAILVAIYLSQGSTQLKSTGPNIAHGREDARSPVPLKPEHVDHVLNEMRGLMAALSDIQAARLSNDLAAIAATARLQSPGKRGAPPPGLRQSLPSEFAAMSRELRKDFALVAQAAETGDLALADRHLSAATAKCVACHEGYRLTVAE